MSGPPALLSATATLSPPQHGSCTALQGASFSNVIDLCDKLGTPKLLFQVTRLSERASELLQVCSTYYVCRVEFGAPGTEEEDACWSFMPLLEHPSPTLAEGDQWL
ncbi:PREDICTED: uncharacterized protein CXorf65 homolog [Pygoscelis adeliae]|uniref:uncharacterized protein CXorf65 homolog n=1 Tax=Pygoscelis adeliae TaxID=9238 RepID=UPI0004F4F33B|nr:PREDICTED: uncharacterized protein CXorf65 homolog [Pygoscelis adeliae]